MASWLDSWLGGGQPQMSNDPYSVPPTQGAPEARGPAQMQPFFAAAGQGQKPPSALAQALMQQFGNTGTQGAMQGMGGQMLQRDPNAVDPRSPELQAFQAQQLAQQQMQRSGFGGGAPAFGGGTLPPWMGGQAGNSGIVPPGMAKPAPHMLGQAKPPATFIPPNFRRRPFGAPSGFGSVGNVGGFGIGGLVGNSGGAGSGPAPIRLPYTHGPSDA